MIGDDALLSTRGFIDSYFDARTKAPPRPFSEWLTSM
jgi:hypothetical protein